VSDRSDRPDPDDDGPELPPELIEMLEQLGQGDDVDEPDPSGTPPAEPSPGSPGGLPPELQSMFDQLGLGGLGGAGGPQLPPELSEMLGQLGLGGGGAPGELPPELAQVFEQLQTPEGLAEIQRQAAQLFGGAGGPLGGFGFGPGGGNAPEGPVDWELATRVALQVAADDDRSPTGEETARLTDAVQLAEHWLDATSLPAPPDAGRIRVTSRQEWINGAVTAMRPLVDPVARASTDAMVDLAREQFDQLSGEDGPELPPEMAPLKGLLDQLSSGDPGAMFRPVGAMLAGLQAGQVLGQLARTLLTGYDLTLPTGPRAEAQLIAVNVEDAFGGWELDLTEVAIVLALHEAALRRLYHAVPWLEAHVQSLVARFASGTVVDSSRLEDLSRELMNDVDPEDPASLEAAMERAAHLRLEPTAEQQRLLERLQGVVCLVGAWARHEVARAAGDRIPSLPRISEVQRRRRAERGDGDDLLAGLLGLDLQPDDEVAGERFVAVVEEALGPEGLRQALEHPENLPDTTELADPSSWLARMDAGGDVPDDPGSLFAELGDAPHEASADERRPSDEDDDGGPRDDAAGDGS
jgi:putative hydrolase